MLIQASSIINLPIGAIETQNKIGKVKAIVIDPKNGEMLGFVVIKDGWFSSQKVLSMKDVLDFDRNGIVIKKEDSLVDKKEIVKINKILTEKIHPIGSIAETKSGKKIGKIFDLVFNLNTLIATKYYMHDIFNERIIDANKVYKIEAGKVIFDNSVEEKIAAVKTEGVAA